MFKDLTKIQINPETQHVHLAIKITENHVHNLVFSLESFIRLLRKDVKKWHGTVHGRYWELQKLPNHVKLFSESYEFHYRFSMEEWIKIKRQFLVAYEKLQ